MFRSGAAGYTDLLNFGGTANLGGFRAGCTNNLIAAGGVLNAPDYTRTCTCSYQLQASFGFVHEPDAELWTLNRLPGYSGAVKALGVNFGAPGNRRKNGVLWLEYPRVYPEGPEAPLEIEAGSMELFRNHASWIENPEDGYGWVGSYGVEGIRNIRLDLGGEGRYDVRLFFAEPDELEKGERVFDIFVQGEKLLADFDIAESAGGMRRVTEAGFKDISVENNLYIGFGWDEASLPAALSGIEVVRSD